MKEKQIQNVVGPQIRKLRSKYGWSQMKLAVILQLNKLDVPREYIAKIENQSRCVRDRELPLIASALNVSVDKLFPPAEALPADSQDVAQSSANGVSSIKVVPGAVQQSGRDRVNHRPRYL